MPLVRWDIVQQPKCKGGLGVGDIIIKNAALLFKWWWRYTYEERSLLEKSGAIIHNEDLAIIPSCALTQGLGPWKVIKRLVNEQQPISMTFLQHLKMKVGNGSNTIF